jgi:hypothetical protein
MHKDRAMNRKIKLAGLALIGFILLLVIVGTGYISYNNAAKKYGS